MNFHVGDSVEVCSREDGFLGSYFTAKIVSRNIINRTFKVEYKSLLADDENGPLIETVTASELRPVPQEIWVPSFNSLDKVDAYDLEGWWAGYVTRRRGYMHYYVYFERYPGVEYEYAFSDLRLHQEFEDGRWVLSLSQNRGLLCNIS